jgi:enoyl-CoA hydratase/carnithine racemase
MSTNKSQFKLTKVNPAYWRATFDNPPINMLGPETMLELQGLVGQFEKDPDLKVVVFDSADPDFFIAHFDISRAADTPREPGPSGLPPWTDLTVRLARAPVISIAAVRGRARGVGNEFALACDLVSPALRRRSSGSRRWAPASFRGAAGWSAYRCVVEGLHPARKNVSALRAGDQL